MSQPFSNGTQRTWLAREPQSARQASELTYKSPQMERLSSCICTRQVCAEHRHLHCSFVAVPRAPAWTSHQAFHGNEHLVLAETRVLRYAPSSQGTWACWSRRETSFLFGSAVFFFCDSILKSVLAVLSKIAFSLSRRRIRVRVLNAERKISYCMQDNFTRFSSFFSQGDNPKISLLQKVEEMALLLVRKRCKLWANIHNEISI